MMDLAYYRSRTIDVVHGPGALPDAAHIARIPMRSCLVATFVTMSSLLSSTFSYCQCCLHIQPASGAYKSSDTRISVSSSSSLEFSPRLAPSPVHPRVAARLLRLPYRSHALHPSHRHHHEAQIRGYPGSNEYSEKGLGKQIEKKAGVISSQTAMAATAPGPQPPLRPGLGAFFDCCP